MYHNTLEININEGIDFNIFMSNKSKVIGLIMMGIVIVFLSLMVFHFWLFPTGITVLEGFTWVNVTPEFTNALYWFIVGIIVFVSARSIKITF